MVKSDKKAKQIPLIKNSPIHYSNDFNSRNCGSVNYASPEQQDEMVINFD
jgi:hypothetical protein